MMTLGNFKKIIVIFLNLGKSKKIVILSTLGKLKNVILLTLGKSKNNCYFADFG